jgi:hypothetical protein
VGWGTLGSENGDGKKKKKKEEETKRIFFAKNIPLPN